MHACLAPELAAATLQGRSPFVADCAEERPALVCDSATMQDALWDASRAYVGAVG